jgi:DNA repair photolyase
MIADEIYTKTILSKSKVFDYTINPYIGCEHGCTYCYARFMRRFTDHKEEWGKFVDVKVNAASLLQREIKKEATRRSLDKRRVRSLPTARERI